MIVNIIPLAGKGQRFIDKGYKIPKPLIHIEGKEMIFRAFECLPNSNKNIFIVFEEHITKFNIDKLLTNNITSSTIISDGLRGGQAASAYKIFNYVDENDTINIGACDNAMIYDIKKYNEYMENENIDFIVWSFKNYKGVNCNPNQYSYCIVDSKKNIIDVSLKKAISNIPTNDHCIVGTFTFKKAKYFYEGYNDLKRLNETINGEFYIDSVIKHCLKKGLKGKVFEIDKYIGFGTPNDLEVYNYWLNYFKVLKNEKESILNCSTII